MERHSMRSVTFLRHRVTHLSVFEQTFGSLSTIYFFDLVIIVTKFVGVAHGPIVAPWIGAGFIWILLVVKISLIEKFVKSIGSEKKYCDHVCLIQTINHF